MATCSDTAGYNTSVTGKACSGKCMGATCGSSTHTWVLAACSGMISLFDLHPDKHLSVHPQSGQPVAASVENFQSYIIESLHEGKFRQLVLIGSPTDIAWLHASLPETVVRYVSAEIAYPLMADWFRNSMGQEKLAQALGQVLGA